MKKYKQHFSILLYVLSISIMVGVGTDAILISEKYIEAEKEVNIYGLIYYYQYLFLSIIFWGISCFLYPKNKLNIAFWIILFVITTLVMLQGISELKERVIRLPSSTLMNKASPNYMQKKFKKSGNFTSLGDEVVIDAIPKVTFLGVDIGLSLAKTIKGDLHRSEDQLILTNIEGISAELLFSTKIEEIVVTHEKIVIY